MILGWCKWPDNIGLHICNEIYHYLDRLHSLHMCYDLLSSPSENFVGTNCSTSSSVLAELLLQSQHTQNDTNHLIIRFVLSILIENYQEAYQIVCDGVLQLLQLFPKDACVTNLRNQYFHHMSLLSTMSQLQLVLNILSMSWDNESLMSFELFPNVCAFAASYSSVIPVLSFAIRIGIMFLSTIYR